MPMSSAVLQPVPIEYMRREIRSANLTVSAGFPSPAGDDLESPVDLVAWMVRHEHATFWYKVSGNSLSELGVMDGDFVAIDRAGKIQPGRMVLALHYGDMLLKLLTRREGRLWLEARSSDRYQPLPVSDQTEIWGVVAGIARRYPVD